MAEYTNNLRLKEIATGDESGTWGTSTNTNLELIGEALGFATVQFSSDADQSETVADGGTDNARALYIKVTSSGNLSATRTLTILPNDLKRVHIIENATSGSQSINISQGSGGNVTILTGETKAVYLDGAGSGAEVVDAFTDLSIAGANLTGTPTAPTASAGTNTTQLATTAFVTTAVNNAEPFPSGTSMLFQQTNAPTGWTKQTTHNDKAIRLQTGTVGTGGSVAFSTALGSGATVAGGTVSGNPGTNLSVASGNLGVSVSGNIGSTTLSINQIPSHSHSFTGRGIGNVGSPSFNAAGTQSNSNDGTFNTNASGGGGSHNHNISVSGNMSGAPSLSGNITSGNLAVGASTAAINVNYVDFIIANKD
tara:strand:- start:1784 stop:2884 length:1101 start_codon:yes stop_codon:yes gene_type:complete